MMPVYTTTFWYKSKSKRNTSIKCSDGLYDDSNQYYLKVFDEEVIKESSTIHHTLDKKTLSKHK